MQETRIFLLDSYVFKRRNDKLLILSFLIIFLNEKLFQELLFKVGVDVKKNCSSHPSL
jgi:hypothetical protein